MLFSYVNLLGVYFLQLIGSPVPQGLHDLYQYDENRYRKQHDVPRKRWYP